MHKYRVAARFLLLLVVAMVASCHDDSEDQQEATALVNVGDNIPDFSLSGSDGVAVGSTSVEGQAYILNFFDTGCPDCQRELKVLQRIYDKYSMKLPIFNVPRSQTKAEVEEYWEKEGFTMPFHIATDKSLYYKFAKRGIPRTYIVDDGGKVYAAFSDSPTADYDTLDAMLGEVLSQAAEPQGFVRLSMRMNVSPAQNDNGYHFHNEYAITTLDVYFFDSDSKEFVTRLQATNLSQGTIETNESYDITYIVEDLKVQAGKYDIFAIANYPLAPEQVTNEMELLNMVDSTSYKNGIGASIPDNGPVMTNVATSLLGIDLIPWINQTYVLTIDMERVLAKVQLGVAQNSFLLKHNERKYAEVNITNYKLVNLNTSYYLFQHKDSLPILRGEPIFDLLYNFGDYKDEGDQYVVDPLFYKKRPFITDVSQMDKYYKNWFGAFTTDNFASMPSADNYGSAYILENTAFKTCQKNGYSPGIVFKAAVSPVCVYLLDTKQNALLEEFRPEYWPNTIYLYNYNFYESIKAVNVISGMSLDEIHTYSDAELKPYGIKQCKFNMGVYETYYTYWIQHRNSDNHMGAMEYGIVRNNFYKMMVKGITGIGNSVITPDVMRDNYPNSYTDVIVTNN